MTRTHMFENVLRMSIYGLVGVPSFYSCILSLTINTVTAKFIFKFTFFFLLFYQTEDYKINFIFWTDNKKFGLESQFLQCKQKLVD